MFLCPGVEKNENTHKMNKITKRLVLEELSNLKLKIESMNNTKKKQMGRPDNMVFR